MTEYLTNYMKYIQQRLESCSSLDELNGIMAEHKDKIAFMQHERIVHFLVTMLFAIVLPIFMALTSFKASIPVLILVTMILVLLAFYIKHYYFLENQTQALYKDYDKIVQKLTSFDEIN